MVCYSNCQFSDEEIGWGMLGVGNERMYPRQYTNIAKDIML